MRRLIFFVLIVGLEISLIGKDYISGRIITKEGLKEFNNYELVYEINIENRKLCIYGERNLDVEYGSSLMYSTDKVAVLYDNNDNFIDARACYVYETSATASFVGNTQICIKSQVSYDEVGFSMGLMYVDSESTTIKLYSIPHRYVSSLIYTDDSILYSTENDDYFVWKILIESGNRISYAGDFVNVELTPLTNSCYIAYLEKEFSIDSNQQYIWHDPPLQYVITDTEILPADKEYPRIKNKTIADFYVVNSE